MSAGRSSVPLSLSLGAGTPGQQSEIRSGERDSAGTAGQEANDCYENERDSKRDSKRDNGEKGVPHRQSRWDDEDRQAAFDELAGILEYDNGLGRGEAEAVAAGQVEAERTAVVLSDLQVKPPSEKEIQS